MSSSEGEYVEFLEPVILEGQVENWLCYIGKSDSIIHEKHFIIMKLFKTFTNTYLKKRLVKIILFFF